MFSLMSSLSKHRRREVLIEANLSLLDVCANGARPLDHLEQELVDGYETVTAGHKRQEKDVGPCQDVCSPPVCVCVCVCVYMCML